MTISTSRDSALDFRAIDGRAIDGYEPVHVPGHVAPVRGETAMFRRRSVQPTRRALLHVQAAGEPSVAPDVGSWYTERAFHFYLAGLRLPEPARLPLSARNRARRLGAAFADLDAACAHMRAADGIDTVIVMASGRSAAAVALWRDAQRQAADALILHSPEFSGRTGLALNIGCPVLVLTWAAQPQEQQQGQRRSGRGGSGGRGGPESAAIRLGGHVTSLQLPPGSAPGTSPDAPGRQAYFDELGRWLGAYMYGPGRDQLL